METYKKLKPIPVELFIRGKKLQVLYHNIILQCLKH